MYVGEWKQGMMNGKGIMTWQDGLRYEGLWFNNLRHGKGKLYRTDGEIEICDWISGRK